MDLSFFRRAEERFASRLAAHPDFGMLLAALRTEQSASPAVRALARLPVLAKPADPLAEILLAGPCWREAVAAQRGCFHPALAGQRVVN
jgi:uncharacterized membrane protein YbaN (DUF454 family)